MKDKIRTIVNEVVANIKQLNPYHQEFIQSTEELLTSIIPVLEAQPQYLDVLERIVEPERQILFRVPWVDSQGKIRVNRGYRIQFNSAIGPFKGALRFHPTVNLSIMKFLAFEQVFKNALTGLPMGGAKGGADFDPKIHSKQDIMIFCQSFMTELQKHIGQNNDIPGIAAPDSDLGVGQREMGYLFGQYKRLNNEFSGTITGKRNETGGTLLRPEACGFGVVWFTEELLKTIHQQEIKGKKVLISGTGTVALFAAEKLIKLGAIPLSLSDSQGTIYEPKGFSMEQLQQVREIRQNLQKVEEYQKYSKTVQYLAEEQPWRHIKADIALPCATQNEIDLEDAIMLKSNGIYVVVEGATMPCRQEAITFFEKMNVSFGPGRAANCGRVLCSGLEMVQNSMRQLWQRDKVEDELHSLMMNVYKDVYKCAEKYGRKNDLRFGSQASSFEKVAKAMLQEGMV